MSSVGESSIEEGSTPARASLGSVIGVALGFLVLLACLGALSGYGSKTGEAAPAFAARFDLGSVPFGLALQPEMHLLPGGERVYTLASKAREASVEEVARALEKASPAQADSSAEEQPEESVDWTLVEATVENGAPAVVFLVNYPWSQANSVIASQFQGVNWKELKDIKSKGGRTAIAGGKLNWNGYAADFVLEREFQPGLRFTDRLRVNMTVNRESWVAYGIWPEQEAGSTEPMTAILRALKPKDGKLAEL